MIERLENLDSEISKKLLFAIKYRIIERRQKVVATLIAYLEDPNFLNTTSGKHLDYSTHDEIAKKAKELFLRHFPPLAPPVVEDDPDEPEPIDPVELDPIIQPPPPKRSCSDCSDDLNECLEKGKPKPLPPKSTTSIDDIKEDMSSFERSGERPTSLEKVFGWKNLRFFLPSFMIEY